MKKSPYIYDLQNCIIFKEPHFTSRQAQIQAALTLTKHGFGFFGVWEGTQKDGRNRGNTIADRLPYSMMETLKKEGF